MRDLDTIYKIRAIFENTIYGYEVYKQIFFKISFGALLSEAKNARKTN